MRKSRIAVCLIIITVLAGCGGSSQTTTTTTPTTSAPSQYKQPAQTKVKTATSLLSNIPNQQRQLEGRINTASTHGVSTSRSQSTLQSSKQYYHRAHTSLQTAKSNFNSANYRLALQQAKNAINYAHKSVSELKKVRTDLSSEYKTAVNNAQNRLQRAYKQYKIAEAYVSSANKAGADTSSATQKLKSAHNTLQSGVSALKSSPPNPKHARSAASTVLSTTSQVKSTAVSLGKKAKAKQAIRQFKGSTNSQLATQFVSKAQTALQQGDFSQVKSDLQRAQAATQITAYATFVTKVKSTDGIQLTALSKQISTAKQHLQDGQSVKIDQLQQSATNARKCVVKVQSAKASITSAKQAASWLNHANLSPATQKVQGATSALSNGGYSSACQDAVRAKKLAQQAKQTETQKKQSNPVVGVLGSIQGVLHSALTVTGVSHSTAAHVTTTVPHVNQPKTNSVNIEYHPPSDVSVKSLNFQSGSVNIPAVNVNTGSSSSTSSTPKTVSFKIQPHPVSAPSTFCRVASATLKNTGTEEATGVSATMTVYSGGSKIMKKSMNLGTVSAGGQTNVQKKLCVNPIQGAQIKSNGYVRIVIRVTSNQKDHTFHFRRQVS